MKTLQPVLLLTALLLLISCRPADNKADTADTADANKALYDSLMTRCNERITQTDSLRQEAEDFMRQTPNGTTEYFCARQFYINSYFNEKNYDRVLQMLAETEQMPGYQDLPGTQADYLYTRSRCYQFTGRHDEAIATSRQIMDLVPAAGDTLAHEYIRTRSVGAMTNVSNIFYFTNRAAQGADWFHALRSTPPALLKECCLRDMMIFEGYLRALAGQSKRAEAVMDSAHALPIYKKTPENTFRDCAFTATVYYRLPHRQGEIEALLRHAITEGRKDRYVPGIHWAMDYLSMLYTRQNRFQEALQLQYQGLEIGLHLQDSAFCARCYSNTSMLYYKWNLLPQALYYSDKALAWDRNRHVTNQERGYLYLSRYRIEQKLPNRTRAQRLRWLASADSCYTGPEKDWHIDTAYEWIMNAPYDVGKGLAELDQVNAGNSRREVAESLRAIALIRSGREAEARKTLLNIKEYTDKDSHPLLDTLMNHYLHLNDNDAIAHLTRLREPLTRVYQETQSRNAVIGADIRYHTKQKEQENRLLTAEVSLKNSRLQSFVLIGLFLLAIGLGIGVWLWMRLRLKEREKQFSQQQLHEQGERLQQIIASRQELNNRNEELLSQLVDIQATHDKTCDLDRVMESLQPSLITNTEEEQFRSAFASLYPTVLHRLRTLCPRVTRTEELFCMLIVLKQTNEEISRTLGITRSSVLKNRYRLRTKLELSEGCDLDAEVRALLLPE